jgi:hypothetical protein
MYLTLVPAYGRDYKSKAEVQRDLDAGKDFIIATYGHRYEGKPTNAEGLRQDGVKHVNIRYQQQRKIGVFQVPGAKALASNPIFNPNPHDIGTALLWGGGTVLGAWIMLRLIVATETRR